MRIWKCMRQRARRWQEARVLRGIGSRAYPPERAYFIESLESRFLLSGELSIMEFVPTTSGAHVTFNQPVDVASLNLYDVESGALGPADVTLVGATVGPVRGSLVARGEELTFVKTGGTLVPDTYTLTLKSGATQLHAATGGLLDGDGDGTGGDDFVATFPVALFDGPIVSVADFARGPGQIVDVPGGASGIPISLSNGAGVTAAHVILEYDPSLLAITDVSAGALLPAGSILVFDISVQGVLDLELTSPTPLEAGNIELARILAQVPHAATYGRSGLLDISHIHLNDGAIEAHEDDGVQAVAYLGDTSGNQRYSAIDGTRSLRVVVGLDSGFLPFPAIDPVIIGDVTGNGVLSSQDATRVLQEAVGLDRVEIPAITPVILPRLTTDTGVSAADGITFDPSITGTVLDDGSIAAFEARVDSGSLTDVTADLTFGAFQFSRGRLEQILNAPLSEGSHTLTLQATDNAGNHSTLATLAFTLDTIAPVIQTFQLAAGSDTGTPGDGVTAAGIVTLDGLAESGLSLDFGFGALQVLAAANGNYIIPGVSLAPGDNAFAVQAVDLAGNTTQLDLTVTREGALTPDIAVTWNRQALEAIRLTVMDPPQATRALAMMSLAQYDTLAAIEGFPAYLVHQSISGPVSIDAALAKAAHTILSALFPGQRPAFDGALNATLSAIADGSAKTNALTLGLSVANAILAIRGGDGSDVFIDYPGSDAVGSWRPTLPMFDTADEPQWGSVTPFALSTPDAFRPGPPPSPDSAAYAASVEEIRALGSISSVDRTADETDIAQFWADGKGSYTPPGHWNQIAEDVALDKGNSLTSNVRLFAQLNIALADSAIAAWDAKYLYGLWRPVDAIRNADADNNAATVVDPNWTPLLITPPHPEYVSGHSTFSMAAATILANAFGDDTLIFVTQFTLPGQLRIFDRFTDAAKEAGRSRIFGGIHYEFTNQAGQELGRNVANAVLQRFALSEDVQAPSVILDPVPAVISANITLTGQILDNISGVALAGFRIDGGPEQDLLLDGQGRFAIPTAFVGGADDGGHTVTITARDAANNSAAPAIVSFLLDTAGPVLSLTSILQNGVIDAESTVTGVADATGSSIVLLNYRIDNGVTRPLAFDSVTGAFNEPLFIGNLATGAHTLTLTARDAAGLTATLARNVTLAQLPPLTITSLTPDDGATELGVTYRPRIIFSRAVNSSTLGPDAFYALGPDGVALAARIVLSQDKTSAWLFFEQPMPGASEITLVVQGDLIKANTEGQALDADGDGVPGGTFTSAFTTVSRSSVFGTTLVGKVVDPGPDLEPMTFDDVRRGPDGIIHTSDDVFLNPIEGARVYILGQESNVAFSDAAGNFALFDVPAGNVKVVVDGRPALNAPAGIFFPEMVMDANLLPGVTNTLMGAMGTLQEQLANNDRVEIYLPRLESGILHFLNPSTPTTITADVLAAPNLTEEQRANLSLVVAPGSAIGENGAQNFNAQVGVSTVPPELVRDMLPPGILQHTFDITIQAPGVAVFTTPVALTVPNVFGLAPGAKVNLLSFDHTTGRLVIDGSMTVSADGKSATTDPGSGVTHPGWHGPDPGTETEPCDDESSPTGPDPIVGPETEDTLKSYFFKDDDGEFTLHFKNEQTDEKGKKLKVLLKIEGPIDEFIEGELKFANDTPILLCPQDYVDIPVRLVKFLPKIGQIEKDRFYGIKIHIEATPEDDPDNKLIEKDIYVYRFVDAADDKHDDGAAEVPKTLNDGSGGVTQRREVESKMPDNAAPIFEVEDSANLDIGTQGALLSSFIFDPTETGDELQTKLKIKEPSEEEEIGEITLKGKSVDKQKVYVDEASFLLEMLAQSNIPIHGPVTLTPAQQSDAYFPHDSTGFTQTEFDLISSPDKIDRIFDAAIAYAKALTQQFDMAIEFTSSPSADAIVYTNLYDTLFPFNNYTLSNTFTGLVEAIPAEAQFRSEVLDPLLLGKMNMAEATFRLSKILNQQFGGGVINFISPYFRFFDLTNENLAATLFGETIAHEFAHSVGLLHILSSVDIMVNGATATPLPIGTRHFEESLEVFRLALATGWDEDQGRQGLVTYSLHNEGNPGGMSHEFPFPPNHKAHDEETRFPIEGPFLWVVAEGNEDLLRTVDMNSVLVDGPGGLVGFQGFRLVNLGNQDVIVQGVEFTGQPGFSLDTDITGLVIHGGESANAGILFDPLLSGEVTSTLIIRTLTGPAWNVELTGAGLVQGGEVRAEMANNNFGGQAVGGELIVPNAVTVTNSGSGALTISDFRITDGSEAFRIAAFPAGFGPDPLVLQPGESVSLDIAFRPDAAGLRRGVIEIVSDDAVTPISQTHIVGTGVAGAARKAENYVAVETPDAVGSPVLRVRTDAKGNWKVVLPAKKAYHFAVFDPLSGLIGSGFGVSAADGLKTHLPGVVFQASKAPDTDGDGLPDDVEFAIGTSAKKADTNGDGIDDFAAVAAGLNPIEGRGFPTGVVASLHAGLSVNDVDVVGSIQDPAERTAFLAASDGLVVVDVSRFDKPVTLGSIALPGKVSYVAADAENRTAVVVTDTSAHIVDVADRTRPVLVKSLSLPGAGPLAIYDGVAYALSGTRVVAFDDVSGAVLQTLDLGGNDLIDITREGTTLVTIDRSNRLTAISIDGFEMTARGDLTLNFRVSYGLTMGGGIVYVPAAADGPVLDMDGGFATVSVADLDAPALIAGPTVPPGTSGIFGSVVLNGSGVAGLVGATYRVGGIDAAFNLLSVADPLQTFDFLTRYLMPATTKQQFLPAVIADGIAFVADSEPGLQIINYLPFDTGDQPPTVVISSNPVDEDPLTPGIQLFEGSRIAIGASIADDRQVARVELLVNGQVVATDLSFPFDFAARLPLLAAGPTALIQARATDTGGNTGLSNVLSYDLLADIVAPEFEFSSPSDGAEVDAAAGIHVRFTEPIDQTLVNAAGVTLLRDGTPVALRSVKGSSSRGIAIVPTSSLPFGAYTLIIDPSIIADSAGNHLEIPVNIAFKVGFAHVIGAAPLSGTVVGQGVDDLTLHFDTDINRFVPQPADFTLIAAGPDTLFDTLDDIAVAIATLEFNAANTQLTLHTAQPLALGSYRLTAPAAKLIDRYGRPMDGEFTGVFPSGNGEAGGDFVSTFTVAAASTLPFDAFPARTYANFNTAPFSGIAPLTLFSPILSVDLNDDGLADVVRTLRGRYFVGFSGGQQVFANVDQVSVIFGLADGGFSDPSVFNVGSGASRVAAGDLDGDGIKDLVVLDNPGDINTVKPFQLSVLLGTGAGFLPELRIDTGFDSREPGAMQMGQFVGSADLDLAILVPAPGFTFPTFINRLLIFAGAGDGTFGAPVAIDVPGSSREHQLLTADLNGDGALDFVTAGVVLLNNGSGYDQSPLNLGATLLAVADFDEDGNLDVVTSTDAVTTDPETGAITSDTIDLIVGLGDGNGAFTALAPLTVNLDGDFGGDTFTRFITAAVGDLNNDSNLDIVLGGASSQFAAAGGVAVLFGGGDGTFAEPLLLPLFSTNNRFQPVMIALGDASGDGLADILAGMPESDTIALYQTVVIENLGNGTFNAPLLGPAGSSATIQVLAAAPRMAADVNGDGILDLIRLANRGVDSSATTLETALGFGDGTFAEYANASTVSMPPGFGTDLVVGDVNNDGFTDALVWQESNDAVNVNARLMLGRADGRFGAPVVLLTNTPNMVSIQFGDVNNDDNLDLIRMGSFTGLIVRLGDGLGGFGAEITSNFQQTGFTAGAFLLGDVNNDGILDAVNPGNNAALGAGDGTFLRAPRPFQGVPGGSVALADINGDHKLDIIGGTDNRLIVAYGNGDGSYQDSFFLSVPGVFPADIQSADINGDGFADLVLSSVGEILVLLNTGNGTFETPVRLAAPGLRFTSIGSVPRARAVFADLNLDGWLDIIAGDVTLLRKP